MNGLMQNNKLIDCVTFFDNNYIFEIRYNILKNFIDYFVVCESKFDHTGKPKKINFLMKNDYDSKKIKYFLLEKPFPKSTNRWQNQALQREYLLSCLDFANPNDYIFFSDPDEIIRPEILINFELKNKYGIFLQDCFNYKINLFNPYETPWEGTRVAKKINIKSIDFMRHKVLRKNLKYSFLRLDKEKNIQIFNDAGWHFNNLMTYDEMSLKLKTFAHSEFSDEKFSSVDVIKYKVDNRMDLFERGHLYKKVDLNDKFPKYILDNKIKFKDFIL